VNPASSANSLERVNYGLLYENRSKLLRTAFGRFAKTTEFEKFREKNASWLEDYAAFMTKKNLTANLTNHTNGDEYFKFEQFEAVTQWLGVKKYANEKGISIIGDMPIYPALDSADVEFHHDMFQLDADGKPLRISGCPPDPFAAGGQVWGNPLYNWDVLEKRGFDWWIARLKHNFELFDIVRIDHFRGFESYWSIPAGDTDAKRGEWVKGPGINFVNAVKAAIPNAKIIAEDLGYLTPEVHALLEASGFPGMKVLQFAFDSREKSNAAYFPYNYPRNCIAYPGTHDNPTAAGWSVGDSVTPGARPEDVQLALDYFGIKSTDELCRAFIRETLACVADTAIIPMQDWLALGSEARMNTPSTTGTNWQWRLAEIPGEALAADIAGKTKLYGRVKA
jgi:4-alpha-glucanotransferase